MITAIPMTDDRIANHFKQALSFAVFDSNGNQIDQFDNPAPEQGCTGKDTLFATLTKHNVSRIYTKKMGKNMLEATLAKGFQVAKINRGRFTIEQLFSSTEHLTPFTDAEQGGPSLYPEKTTSPNFTLTPVKNCCRTRNQLILGQRRRG